MLVHALDPVHDALLAAEIVALERDAYAVEAGLIGSEVIPGLHDTPAELVSAGLTWFGVRDAWSLHGAVAVEEAQESVGIDRLVVEPRAFRRGIGTALVRHVLARADGRPVTVSTGRDNAPARSLYTRLGFVETGEEEVEPGLWLTHYARSGVR